MSDCTSNTWEGAAHGEEVILIISTISSISSISSISIIPIISTIQDQRIDCYYNTGHNHHFDHDLDQSYTHFSNSGSEQNCQI